MARRTHAETELLNDIVRFYLNSGDFNGIPLNALIENHPVDGPPALKNLVQKQIVEVISGDWDNPHVKRTPAWPLQDQLKALDSETPFQVCLYPSEKYMKRVLRPHQYRDRPFTRLLALSHPQLEPIFFELSVLDRYQSDPRYVFNFHGLSGSISVTEEYYRSHRMSLSDQVLLQSFGLGSTVHGQRVAVVFLRYLSPLPRRQQQHWHSHRVRGKCTVESNYFRRSLFGEWTHGISIYEALRAELHHVNKMCELIGLPPLFIRDFADEPPRGFGLLMRPTRHSYLDFAHTLDKMLSENLNLYFFSAEGIALDETITRRGGREEVVRKGTLRLLEEWLTKRIRFKVEGGPLQILEAFKNVRKLRQKPAHAVVDDEYSPTYQEKKEKLISEVYISLSNIRMFFQTHPRTRDYRKPDDLKLENLVVY